MKTTTKKLLKLVAYLIVVYILLYFIGYQFGKSIGANTDGEILLDMTPIAEPLLWIGRNILPFVLLILAIGYPILVFKQKRKVEAIASNNQDEDEAYPKMEKVLGNIMYHSSLVFMISLVSITGFYATLGSTASSLNFTKLFYISIISFVVIIIELLFAQNYAVSATKNLNPHITVDYLDKKFQEKFYQECDEAERYLIGQAAYKSYMKTQKAGFFVSFILVPITLFYPPAFIGIVSVAIVLLVSLISYKKAATINEDE